MWNVLIEFDQFEVHKEVIARWHKDVIEKTLRERLSEVVRAYLILNVLQTNINTIMYNTYM